MYSTGKFEEIGEQGGGVKQLSSFGSEILGYHEGLGSVGSVGRLDCPSEERV